ncbi:MAG: MBL fold metallo-hydrolase [Candidatus Pacebacteria bacterium]|nr:MBL fold metallo-hydrolase [Candidatus Paceibacterota bacterium]
MIITYHGAGMVKLQVGETIVAVNPIGKDSGTKVSRFGADLALVSIPDPRYNGVENLSYGEREPFVISGPGEYEVSGTFVRSVSSTGPNGLINTIYTLTLDNLNVCHLGALASADLSEAAIESIGVVDILFVPIGGAGTLDAKLAEKVSNMIAPKMIIPVEWESEAELKNFLKEAGESNPERADKLTLKRKDLEGKESAVMVINQS